MPNRRSIIATAGIALTTGLAGCSGQENTGGEATNTETETTEGGGSDESDATPTTSPDSASEQVAVTLNNVGASAWELTEDESGSVAPTGTENPTMTFQTGTRYMITNNGWDAHPLAFRAADDTPLLSQSTEGEFEDDADVNWVNDGGSLAFTFTEALAEQVDYYICTIHPSMRGSVESG